MKALKRIIKLFCPPALLKACNKIFISSSLYSTIHLMSGDMETCLKDCKDKDVMVVNYFCKTKYFTLIKPKYYFLAGPSFFGDIESYAKWLWWIQWCGIISPKTQRNAVSAATMSRSWA